MSAEQIGEKELPKWTEILQILPEIEIHEVWEQGAIIRTQGKTAVAVSNPDLPLLEEGGPLFCKDQSLTGVCIGCGRTSEERPLVTPFFRPARKISFLQKVRGVTIYYPDFKKTIFEPNYPGMAYKVCVNDWEYLTEFDERGAKKK